MQAKALALVVLSAAVALFVFGSCKKTKPAKEDADDNVTFDRQAWLTYVAENIVVPKVESFAEASTVLEVAVAAYCQANTNVDTKLAAQESLREAVLTWQYLELMQFGPLATMDHARRNKIYSWPLTNACGVDREVTKAGGAGYELPTTTNRLGLDAIEYLLFDEDNQHACSQDVEDTQGFNELSESDRIAARCTYLKLLTSKLKEDATELKVAWSSDYVQNFAAGKFYSGIRATVNAVTNAMFYLDIEIKDMKLAIPAGISDQCLEDSCPDKTEWPRSKISLESLQANTQAFSDLFFGKVSENTSKAIGLNDYLIELGREDLAFEMGTAIEAFLTNLKGTGTDLEQMATGYIPNECSVSTRSNRQVEICSLHADSKKITDILKTEFLSVLDLEAPARAEGDND